MKLYSCLFVSFIIHFFIFFPWWYTVKKNEAAEHVLLVHAYVEPSSPLEKTIIQSQLGLIKKTEKLVKPSTSKNIPPNHVNDDKNEKITHQLLLKMLHEQIAKKQIYPESAIALNQSGTVTIRFILSPEGIIHHIILDKSSGVTSLDLAALKAVQTISPIPNISHFLKIEEPFSVDIVYR